MKRIHAIVDKHIDPSAKGSGANPEWWDVNGDHLCCMNEKMASGAEFMQSHKACVEEGHAFEHGQQSAANSAP